MGSGSRRTPSEEETKGATEQHASPIKPGVDLPIGECNRPRACIPRSRQGHAHDGGTYTFTVRVADSGGQSAIQQFTIQVLP
jgi:hypothetical protein